MQPVHLNFEDSYISLVNKETQTDATDSFQENYYLRFHRSQNSSAIQSEQSSKLLGNCQKRGEGGTVTIKDNTIIIKEPFRRNSPSLIENISQNTGPSGKSAYCEEVLIPYLKTAPPDCELHEHLAIEFTEDTPDYQSEDSSTNNKDMKDKKTNSGGISDSQDTKPPCEIPETTELTDLGRGLKYVASAVFSPICQNCEAKNADDTVKAQDGDDPCKKASSSQQLLNAMSSVSHGIKNVASKMMTAICPNKTPDQCAAPPPKKPPETPPPEPEVTKSGSTGSVKGAYTACKKKSICIAKGVRSSISSLLCTPCPCPKPCEAVPCFSPTMTPTPLVDNQTDSPPKEEETPTGPFVEEALNCSAKKEEEAPPCPVVTELPPCPPPEEKLPCQPKDVELPPCPKKVIEKPPCPPDPEKPYCPPPKEKKCPPKERKCVPVDKCKIKDPVMAVRMPKCKGEKPLYYLTDRSKICKNCLEKSSSESMSNINTEDVAFDASQNDQASNKMENNFDRESFHSLKDRNITDLNNEIKPNNETKPNLVHESDASPNLENRSCVVNITDLNNDIISNNEMKSNLVYENDAISNSENQSSDNADLSSQSNNLPRVVSVSNEIISDDTVINSQNGSSINTESSAESSKVAHVVSLNNELKSNSHVSIDIELNKDQGYDVKVRLGKPVADKKDSMNYLVHNVRRANEPTPMISEESQLIKITESASTEKQFPIVKNVNQRSNASNDEDSDSEENEATAIERASVIMAPIVSRLAGAVDSTITTLKERLDLDRFSSTIKESVRDNTEQSSTYDNFDKRNNISVPTQELSNIDQEPIPDEPSSLTKSMFTTIKSKLFGMFSDRERTEDAASGPVLQRTSKASVRFKNSDGDLD